MLNRAMMVCMECLSLVMKLSLKKKKSLSPNRRAWESFSEKVLFLVVLLTGAPSKKTKDLYTPSTEKDL